MTSGSGRAQVVADTQALSYFTAQSPLSRAYRELLGERVIALSYFVRTELEGRSWGEQRRARLEELYGSSIDLTPSPATSTWYNRANVKRRQLRLVSQVADMDLWVIAHAAEHRLPFMSHDRGACEVARGLGVEVLTALDD